MMKAFASLAQQFQQMPRIMQWTAIAAAIMIAWLFWAEVVSPTAAEWNKQADAIQRRVDEVRSNHAQARQLRDPRRAAVATALGPVRVPESSVDGTNTLNDAVLEILQTNGVTVFQWSTRTSGRLSSNALFDITKGVRRVDRHTGDLTFDASPDTAAAIIAQLESSPHIDSVSSVRLTKDASRRVKVSLAIESWLLASDGPAGGRA